MTFTSGINTCIGHEKMSTSKFAEKQLTKHGWKEGSGLGKDESGITDAIKVKIKHDTHGVGHNKGDEFSFHWWDHVFNKAASSISVNSSQDGVSLSKSKENGPISTRSTKTYDNKSMLYGQFIKGATLTNGQYEARTDRHSDEEEDCEEETKPKRIQDLEDAELLKACGGLTAHKAARHGLKLNGKLARIEEQEALLLKKYKSDKQKEKVKKTKLEEDLDSDIKVIPDVSEIEDNIRKKAKKKKKDKNKSELVDSENSKVKYETVVVAKSEKERKKDKKKDKHDKRMNRSDSAIQDESIDIVTENQMTDRKKKRKLTDESEMEEEKTRKSKEYDESYDLNRKKKKKKKKRKKSDTEN